MSPEERSFSFLVGINSHCFTAPIQVTERSPKCVLFALNLISICAVRHYPEYNNRTYLYGTQWAPLMEAYDVDQGKDPFTHIRYQGSSLFL